MIQRLTVKTSKSQHKFFGNIIGPRLRRLRDAKILTQGDVEKRGGLLRRDTSRLENGRESAEYFLAVRNATVWLPSRCHHECMPRKKSKKETTTATRADVKKEMAQPRMARSARIAELNLDTARNREQPSSTMPGTVHKIIPSPRANRPEKAQIALAGAPRPYRDLRIENMLTDEHGDDVRLKKGAHVEMTVTANDDRRRD
jgi:hypothetical protein